ncbi:hypothetical protein C8N46_102264 [Kordia periserrulae]|uniref:Uncharacterized protein n=1 Tax=Kordia periserrulae TaxID=701523 RepID=A0A2T6C3I1_9FLAO|nr:hypothetical protein [Kordia periserrulae]PTX62864.1 hypothetical protein C8N46_102264 [Kordia periserrulae]
MIGIIIFILIGRKFYQLAAKYKQKLAWIYFIVGIASYYAGEVLAALVLLFYAEVTGDYESIASLSDAMLIVISIATGIITCYGAYQLLKKKWHKEYLEKERNKPKISDIGKSEEEIASNYNSF